MTRRKIFIVVSLSVLTFASCKKDYTCFCYLTKVEPAYTYNSINYPESINNSVTSENIKHNKKSAESLCSFKDYVIQETSPNDAQGQGPTLVTNACVLEGGF